MNSPTLRLAWREVTRHRRRSLLVCALVGLPVMISVAVSTLYASGHDYSPSRDRFGAAHARATWQGYPTGPNSMVDPEKAPPAQAISRDEALRRARQIADGVVVPIEQTATSLVSGKRAWLPYVQISEFGNHLADGLVTLESGRLALAADEVTVSAYLHAHGVAIGDRVVLGGARLTVVGVSDETDPSVSIRPEAQVITDANDPDPNAGPENGVRPWEFLIGGPEPTSGEIAAWNQAGFEVETASSLDTSTPSSEEHQLIAIVATALVIEVVLLAGPAFAVGVRRQRHDLALLAVAGGDARHLRRTVLFQGLALGSVASISGAALGLLAGRLTIPVANHFGATFGAFDIPWPAAIAAACLGITAAGGAAFLPARQASRTDVTTALAGRQPDPKVRTGWPIIGAAILAVSVIGSLAAPTMVGPMVALNSFVTRDFANAWWAVTAVVGAILLTPWLIRMAARLGRWLPLPLRLALRESDRHRARTAPAIAAVMASVSAVTALGIGSSSAATAARDYVDWQPVPTGTLQIHGRHVDAIIEQVATSTGVRVNPLQSIPMAFVRSHSKAHVYQGLPVAVADVPTLAAWGIPVSEAQRQALASGKALVASQAATTGKQVRVDIDDPSESEPTRLMLPAFGEKLRTPDGLSAVAGAVISPETARTLHLKVTTDTAIADRPASELDIQAIEVAAATASPAAWSVTVTRPRERPTYFWAFVMLAVAGTAAVLMGTFSATALTLTDASADLRTLGEVGAAPRTRRLVAGSHALLIALLGAGLGVLVGLTPGIVAARLLTAAGNYDGWTLDIPWLLFGLLLIVLPLTAGAITAAVSGGPRPRPIREAV